MALFGQDFANQFLRQSTSWLGSIIFAVGPLGVPAAVIAAIRVGGYGSLKSAVGRAGERIGGIEKDLLSSTSNEVCELWDGEKVVKLEETKPFIQELIYVDEKWYNLRDLKCKEFPLKANRQRCKSDIEAKAVTGNPGKGWKNPYPPLPNLSLNLSHEDRDWELLIAAILGIFLQLTVLVIAGLSTFYPK